LKTISGEGRLFNGSQRAQLQGIHPRRHEPAAGETYVAGLDIGGQAFGSDGGSRHDATVLTIARAGPPAEAALVREPRLEVVEHLAFSGEPHDALFARIADLLGRVWRVRRLSVDATGLGETLARLLVRALGDDVVRPVRFSVESKSRLGYGLLAAVNGGRARMYAADGSREYRAFWQEIEAARVAYRPNQAMNFYVAPADGHDDYLVSLALAVDAAGDFDPRPRVARGRIQSLSTLN
jgi:phage FluMu gp28-like protein